MGCGSSKENSGGAAKSSTDTEVRGPRPRTTPTNGAPSAHAKVTTVTDTRVKDTRVKDTRVKDTTPKDTRVKNTRVNDTTPKDTAPKDTAPKDTAPKDTAVKDTTSKDTAVRVANSEDIAKKEEERARKKARVAAVSGVFLLHEVSPSLTRGLGLAVQAGPKGQQKKGTSLPRRFALFRKEVSHHRRFGQDIQPRDRSRRSTSRMLS